jgi:putative phage-type endonuclease
MSDDFKIQGSQAWLDYRKDKITATDSVVCAGLNPWKSPAMLYEEKVLGTVFSMSPASEAAMARGSALEEEARLAYQELKGCFVFPDVVVHPKYDWMMASLDGISEDNGVLVEIKAPGEKSFRSMQKKGTPIYYKAQMTWQMYVTGVDRCDFFCYYKDGEEIETYYSPYKFDGSLALKLLHSAKRFRQCMLNKLPPDW